MATINVNSFSLDQKISWLQQHYASYARTWYLESIPRTNAIFRKEYTKAYALQCQKDEAQYVQTVHVELEVKRDKLAEYLNPYAYAEYGMSFRELSRREQAEMLRTHRQEEKLHAILQQ